VVGTVVVTGSFVSFVAFDFAVAVAVVTAGVVAEVLDDVPPVFDARRFAWTTSGAMAMHRRRRRRRMMPTAAVVGLSRFLMSVMVYFIPLVRVSRTTSFNLTGAALSVAALANVFLCDNEILLEKLSEKHC